MGIPIDPAVQEGDARGYATPDRRVSSTAIRHKASASMHSLVDQHLSEPLPDHEASLEDVLAYADAQYYRNTIVPEGAKESPSEAIRRGLLRTFWGPETPQMTAAPTTEKVMGLTATDVEKANNDDDLHTRRMLRKVTVLGAFYLITTDIMGPFNTAYVFSQVGYVPATLCYFFLGIGAWYAGNLLSVLYLRVDSDQYPVKSYGGIVLPILGNYGRILSDTLQIIQLVVNCGTLILSNAQSMDQIIQGGGANLCFIVAIVVFLIVQLIVTPIRSLKGVGIFANTAVFMNVALVFITIAFVATSEPNYAAAKASYGIEKGPIVTSAFVSQPLANKVNGIMNMVFAYAGAMIFPDFLSEMRRPWDFWKAMSCAQMLIVTVYMSFGLVVYSQQGQFTESLAYYGVSVYSQQTVGNVIAILTGLIAGILYGNIAQKLCYNTVVVRWCNGPALMTNRGWGLWLVVGAVFWPAAFIIGAAVPQIQTISGLVAALCMLQFSYTFPYLLKVALDVQLIAMREDGAHKVGEKPNRKDTWLSPSRWIRGIYTGATTKEKILNISHIILFLAATSTACLGLYGSTEDIKTTFESGAAATTFGCAAPS